MKQEDGLMNAGLLDLHRVSKALRSVVKKFLILDAHGDEIRHHGTCIELRDFCTDARTVYGDITRSFPLPSDCVVRQYIDSTYNFLVQNVKAAHAKHCDRCR